MANSTPEPGVKRLGQIIRDLRLRSGETQKQLGAVLGYTHAAVSDIELGKTNLTVKDLAVIASHFGIPMVGLIEKAYMLAVTPEPELNVEAELENILQPYAAAEASTPILALIQQVSDQRVREAEDQAAIREILSTHYVEYRDAHTPRGLQAVEDASVRKINQLVFKSVQAAQSRAKAEAESEKTLHGAKMLTIGYERGRVEADERFEEALQHEAVKESRDYIDWEDSTLTPTFDRAITAIKSSYYGTDGEKGESNETYQQKS